MDSELQTLRREVASAREEREAVADELAHIRLELISFHQAFESLSGLAATLAGEAATADALEEPYPIRVRFLAGLTAVCAGLLSADPVGLAQPTVGLF